MYLYEIRCSTRVWKFQLGSVSVTELYGFTWPLFLSLKVCLFLGVVMFCVHTSKPFLSSSTQLELSIHHVISFHNKHLDFTKVHSGVAAVLSGRRTRPVDVPRSICTQKISQLCYMDAPFSHCPQIHPPSLPPYLPSSMFIRLFSLCQGQLECVYREVMLLCRHQGHQSYKRV